LTTQLSTLDCANVIIKESRPAIKIKGFIDSEWYRKPRDYRHGPWYKADYDFIDKNLWEKSQPLIYFVKRNNKKLKYIGKSVKSLKERWRESPACDEPGNRLTYDVNGKTEERSELNHDVCWGHMCKAESEDRHFTYVVSVIHKEHLIEVLSNIDHEISGILCLKNYPEILVEAMESWFIELFKPQLWNKIR